MTCLFLASCCSEEAIDDPEDIFDITKETVCLNDYEIKIHPYTCENSEDDGECEFIYLGSLSLSTDAKENFTNFCPPVASEYLFENDENITMPCRVIEKSFETRQYTSTRYSQPCVKRCLDIQMAKIDLESESFTMDISLYTGYDYKKIAANQYDYVNETAYRIRAWTPTENGGKTGQSVFLLPIEDENYNPVIPDTVNIRFHETIDLNNKVYTNIYSNENKENVNNYNRKEKVYFNVEKGLIAVRDSLSTLWTIVE